MERGSNFQPTRWTQVSLLRSENPQAAAEAAEYLFSIYWYPLYIYALRKWSLSDQAAEDLVQSFMMKIYEQGTFIKADREKSKLRTFLITAFNAHINGDFRKTYAQKRGGGQFLYSVEEELDLKDTNEEELGVAYDVAWAKRVMEQAYEKLALQIKDKEEADILLKLCKESMDYETACRELQTQSGALRTRVSRLRKKLGLIIREEVAATLSPDDDIEEELSYLIKILKK